MNNVLLLSELKRTGFVILKLFNCFSYQLLTWEILYHVTSMASETVKRRKEDILEDLREKNVTTIVLHGEHGVGKTWTAREVSISAMREGLTYRTLWVYLNKKYDSKTLHESIARQLSLLSTEEWEDDDEDEKAESSKDLELRISTMLKEEATEIHKKESEKFLLLILDDVCGEDEENSMSYLRTLLGTNDHNFFKCLITMEERTGQKASEGLKNEIENVGTKLHQIRPLSPEESESLLRSKITQISDSLTKCLANISKGFPATIITIGAALNFIGRHDYGARLLGNILEGASNDEKEADLITRLLCRSYDMLPKGSTIDCFWHGVQYFLKHDAVHYNELITHWIIEGYFGGYDQIQKAYEKGHDVLMELLDSGMLRKQEDNMVIMEQPVLSIRHHRRSGFNGTASLDLPNVFEVGKREGFGKMTQTDGMIKSLCGRKHWEKVSTLLIDGSCLSREVPEAFFQHMQGLEVFAIFNRRLRSPPWSSMKGLAVLVLRGCDLLKEVNIDELENLRVLEISGAALDKLCDDFFQNLPHLQSLNLSAARIEALPHSFSNLRKLRWLVLRRCLRLQTLPSLRALPSLEVIDLHGAVSLRKVQDKNFSFLKDLQLLDLSRASIDRLPCLHNLGNLTGLVLSGCARLNRLPRLQTLTRLQILDVSNAGDLKEVHDESLEKNARLQIFDLSGPAISQPPSNQSNACTEALKGLKVPRLSGDSALVELGDESFENLKCLQILNLSRSKIKELPSLSNPGNLRELLLVDCSSLQKLPRLEGLEKLQKLHLSGCVELVELPHLSALENLEVLDLSGCTALKVENQSFEKMSHLRILDLSETKIDSLPTLCDHGNLLHLLLRKCIALKELPPLEHLLKLEVLNLSGARSLGEIDAQFLEGMSQLQILDLSETLLTELPSLSKLINLRQLNLRGCSLLKTMPILEALTKLEAIDLSGTAVASLPDLKSCSNLRQLLLKDCSRVEELQRLDSFEHLEILDLSGTKIKRFPDEISELTSLERLGLPDLRDVHEFDWQKIKHLPEEINWDQCGIFEHTNNLEKPTIFVRGTEIFQCLEKHPNLWETNLKQFRFFVAPITKQGEDGCFKFCKDGHIFRHVYFRTRHCSEENYQFLEIHGSYNFPDGFESVLKHTTCLSVVDNKYLSCLSILGDDAVGVLRGCWIERCTKMESVDISVGRNLEFLWVSNLPVLKNLCSGGMQTAGFKNLKHLYLDCCPTIENVFPSSQFPENLEVLHVKFCDTLKTLFECGTGKRHTLQKLQRLHLLELPELRSIGIEFAPGTDFEHRECPKLVLKRSKSVGIARELNTVE